LFDGYGSVVSGIDIEFVDAVDGHKKYCQVKAGPETINKDDVKTISDHFKAVRNLARVNNMNIGLDDLVIGVLYGQQSDLSANYKKLQDQYPVITGADFWYHLTGDQDFYEQLTNAIGEIALEYNGVEQLDGMIEALAKDIEEAGL
ncbi:MAG: PmeII family type II restriction endonuclease, partial [Rikenellaceae bacterium]